MQTDGGTVIYNKEESQVTDDVYEVIPSEGLYSSGFSNPNYEADATDLKQGLGDVTRCPSQYAPPPPPYSSRNNGSIPTDDGRQYQANTDNSVYIDPI